MKKEFVTYEQALDLAKLKFNKKCFGYYGIQNELNIEISSNLDTNLTRRDFYAAPTFSQAFRWFREKYKLHSYIHSDYSWNISGGIWDLNGYKDLRYDWDSEPYATYEEAESACLDELIEIVRLTKP
jgi:hypothetical protein